MDQTQNPQESAPVTPPPPAQPQATPGVAPAENNTTLMGILAYIGILVIIPYLMAKDDPSVKFHIKQGLVLVVIEIAVMVVGNMLYILAPVLMIVNLGALVLSVIGIINVVNKKEVPLPLIGQFSSHFKI
jgi:uncharacterized membrane protein